MLLVVLQANTIGEFVSKFADLQTELETLIQAQRDKEEELEREKNLRKDVEQRYKVNCRIEFLS